MILAYPALAALLASAPAGAVTDPAFVPALHQIEERMPRYQSVETTIVNLPASSISLGASAKSYQCWRLQLTSDRGKKVREIMERLKSLQNSIVELKETLANDLSLYTVSTTLDAILQQRIAAENQSLDALYESYRSLQETGQKEGLIRRVEKGFLRDRPAIIPIIKNDDYTMVYDDSAPECRIKKSP